MRVGYSSFTLVDKLISFPMEVSEKAVFVASMGDCYLTLENKQKAKECFNQAFMMSLQSQDPQLQAYFQQKVAWPFLMRNSRLWIDICVIFMIS